MTVSKIDLNKLDWKKHLFLKYLQISSTVISTMKIVMKKGGNT